MVALFSWLNCSASLPQSLRLLPVSRRRPEAFRGRRVVPLVVHPLFQLLICSELHDHGTHLRVLALFCCTLVAIRWVIVSLCQHFPVSTSNTLDWNWRIT